MTVSSNMPNMQQHDSSQRAKAMSPKTISTSATGATGQEAIDFSSTVNPHEIARDNRATGEMLVPTLNEYDIRPPEMTEQHQSEKKEPSDLDKFFKKAVYLASGVGFFGGLSSSLANAVLGKDSWTLKKVNALQNVIARVAIGSSAAVQVYNNFRSKSLFKVLGYSYETLLSILSPFKTFGLHRGLCFMLYHIPEIVSSVKPMDESKSFAHDYSQIASRAKDAFKFLMNGDSYKKAAGAIFGNNGHGDILSVLLGAWGSLLSCAGVGWWMVTGDSAKGGLVKGIGEGLVDLFQIAPDHWNRQRNFFVGSGVTFLLGTICETVSKMFKDNPVLGNLYFAGSTLGRLQFALSEINHETTYQPGVGPQEGWDNKITYAGIVNNIKSFITGKAEKFSSLRNTLPLMKRAANGVENAQRQMQKSFAQPA